MLFHFYSSYQYDLGVRIAQADTFARKDTFVQSVTISQVKF